MALFRKKKALSYDPQTQEPAIRKSICTGEMTAGFVDRQTGRFTGVMAVKSVEEYQKCVGAARIRILY